MNNSIKIIIVISLIMISGCLGLIPDNQNNQTDINNNTPSDDNSTETQEDKNDKDNQNNNETNTENEKQEEQISEELKIQRELDNNKYSIVSKKEESNYDSIKKAINESYNYQTILIKEGIYNESVKITTDIKIYGIGKVKINKNQYEDYAIKVKNSKVSINGLNINGSVIIDNKYKDWKFINNKLYKGNKGLEVYNSESSYNINNNHFYNQTYSIYMEEQLNKWSIKNNNFYNSKYGISYLGERQEYNINCLKFENVKYKLNNFNHNYNNCENNNIKTYQISDFENKFKNNMFLVDNNEELNITLDKVSDGDIVIIESGEYNSLDINKNLKITNKNGQVNIKGSDTDACIKVNNNKKIHMKGDITLEECSHGIRITDNNRNWILQNINIKNTDYTGILVTDNTGDWKIKNVTVKNTDIGLRASSNKGNWLVINSEFRNIKNTGIITDSSKRFGKVIYSYISGEKNHVSSKGSEVSFDRNYFTGGSPNFKEGSRQNTNNICDYKDCRDKKELWNE